MPKSTATVRLSDDMRARVAAYRTATGCESESAAIRELIELGLDAFGSDLAARPLARFIREVMQGQLDLFRGEFEARCDEMEDRVAKVASRGTKASLHAAALLGDVARATVPAFSKMSAEQVWAVYEALGGAVQQGLPLEDARRQARERLDG